MAHRVRCGTTTATSRTLAIYLDRIIGATGERVAWPQASFERPRFLSDFAAIELASYNQSLLAITPYVSSLYDIIGSDNEADGGVDVFWKPNGQMQLTATVNPDFGQVESDDLVVNFDATETFISDKRPFFTENQGIFEFTTPSDDSQLLYTRRIGGPTDDGEGSGDIIGSAETQWQHRRDQVRRVRRRRSRRGRPHVRRAAPGARLRHAEPGLAWRRAWSARFSTATATVVGVDHNWRPTARWNVRTRVIGSDIDQSGQSTSDTGATIWADYEMDHGWRQQLIGMHFGNELQINDAGLSLAQQHQLPALATEPPLHRAAGRVPLRVEGLALASQHRLTTITGNC